MKELIVIRILELVNKPIRAEIVFAQLAVDFVAATKEEIHLVVENMVLKKQLIELEYRLDGGIRESILFPVECDILIKFSNGVHSFIRKQDDKTDKKVH